MLKLVTRSDTITKVYTVGMNTEKTTIEKHAFTIDGKKRTNDEILKICNAYNKDTNEFPNYYAVTVESTETHKVKLAMPVSEWLERAKPISFYTSKETATVETEDTETEDTETKE